MSQPPRLRLFSFTVDHGLFPLWGKHKGGISNFSLNPKLLTESPHVYGHHAERLDSRGSVLWSG